MNPIAPPPAYMDDRALVARIASGDESALAALYDRWVGVVHALALRIVGDADDADDVVEETFWQVWRRATSYEETRGGVSTWLLIIARARALDRRRSSERRRVDRVDEIPEPGDQAAEWGRTPAPDPAAAAEASDRRAIVVAALAQLPAEQRETLELAYFGGLSQSEIADQTGQPLGTVKTRMRLAMQKLRERLNYLRSDGGTR
jgi:RNA polymerase sigma-70 factor (ECF subfamily)